MDIMYGIVAELSEATMRWVLLERVAEAARAHGITKHMVAMHLADWVQLGVMIFDDEEDEQPCDSVRFIVQPFPESDSDAECR